MDPLRVLELENPIHIPAGRNAKRNINPVVDVVVAPVTGFPWLSFAAMVAGGTAIFVTVKDHVIPKVADIATNVAALGKKPDPNADPAGILNK